MYVKNPEQEMAELTKQMMDLMRRMQKIKQQQQDTCPICYQKILTYKDWNKLHDMVNLHNPI